MGFCAGSWFKPLTFGWSKPESSALSCLSDPALEPVLFGRDWINAKQRAIIADRISMIVDKLVNPYNFKGLQF